MKRMKKTISLIVSFIVNLIAMFVILQIANEFIKYLDL